MTNLPKLDLYLANPRGFCAGVVRAIEIVERALIKYGAPVYVRHEIVHNRHVVDDLKAKGAIFVEELDECPTDRPVIFSAHGVPKSVPENAERRNMLYVDATCPLVSKVHREAERAYENQEHVILIGHKGHPEVIGTMGQLPEGAVTLVEVPKDVENLNFAPDAALSFATQTTLSVDDTADVIKALQAKFPNVKGPRSEDICYATTNRQFAVKEIAAKTDAFFVVGAPNSSNSNRLVEVALTAGSKTSQLIESAQNIDWGKAGNLSSVGISAGASAPEVLVAEVIQAFRDRYDVNLILDESKQERVQFKIPKILSDVEAPSHV